LLIHRDARVANGVQVAELAQRFRARGVRRPTGVNETPGFFCWFVLRGSLVFARSRVGS